MSGQKSREANPAMTRAINSDMNRFFHRGPAILCLVLAICSVAILINDL